MRIPSIHILCGLLALSMLCCSKGGPNLNPDCTSLTPAPCSLIPEYDIDGSISYASYRENCTKHECVVVEPQATEYIWKNPSTNKNSTIDSWFCDSSIIEPGYTARVEKNTGLPPGKKEDQYAYCMYQRLEDLLELGNCRDASLFTCNDCLAAYRIWLCTVMFKKCITFPFYPEYRSTSNLTTSTNISTYGEIYSMGDVVDPKISYYIFRPCRGICHNVVRKCPPSLRFECKLINTSDWIDWPKCNKMGTTFKK